MPMREQYDRREIVKAAAASALVGALGAGVKRAAAAAEQICYLPAAELARQIRARELSAREVMQAHLEQIGRWNPKVNAIVAKLDDDKCLALADEADRRTARGGDLPPLHGLPIAFKDLQSAVGFPYTRGSLVYKDA